jgi:hypothetical protein
MDYQTFSPTNPGVKWIPTIGYLAQYTGDAQEVFCLDVRDKFYADPTSTVAADGVSIINRVTGGRWHRRCQPDVFWMSQTEMWYDASLGNDSNSGARGLPIKTMGEFVRRTNGNNNAGGGILYTAAALTDPESTLFYQYTANNNRQWQTINGALPITPTLWYDAADINANGDGNAGFVDGQSYSSMTWKNKGSFVGGNAPLITGSVIYRAVASAGKCRNAPAIEFNHAGYFQTSNLGLTGPSMWVVVWQYTDASQNFGLVDTAPQGGHFALVEFLAATPTLFIANDASSSFAAPGNTASINQYHYTAVSLSSSVASGNWAMLDQDFGAPQLSANQIGNFFANGATLGAANGGTGTMKGQILSAMLIDGQVANTDVTLFRQWAQYKYGATFPQ